MIATSAAQTAPAPGSLRDFLMRTALAQLAARRERIAALRTPAQVAEEVVRRLDLKVYS